MASPSHQPKGSFKDALEALTPRSLQPIAHGASNQPNRVWLTHPGAIAAHIYSGLADIIP